MMSNLTNKELEKLFMTNGFEVKQLCDNTMGLKPYCFNAGHAIADAAITKHVSSDIACYELRYYDGEFMRTLKRCKNKKPLLELIEQVKAHNSKFNNAFKDDDLDAWDNSHPLAPWRARLTCEDDTEFYESGMTYSESTIPPNHPSHTNHHMYVKDVLTDLSIYECRYGDFHHIEDYDDEVKV